MGRKVPGPYRAAEPPNQIMNIRHNYKFVLSILSAVLILLSISPVNANTEENDYDSVIVVPKKTSANSKRTDRLMRRQGIKYRKVVNDTYVIPLDESSDKEKSIIELRESGLFDLVEPDYKISLDEYSERNYTTIIKHGNELITGVEDINQEIKEITPNDRGFTSQYYLKDINATKAWSITVGNSLSVAVLDTGVDSSHPDLAGKVITDNSVSPNDRLDDIGHGTEVSGIIAANTNNSQGIAGIAWNTMILPVKVTDENGQARVSTVVAALDKAYNSGAKIVQISLSTSQFSQTLKDAIALAQSRGILIISTGGNTATTELRYPAAFEGVIGVGAVSQSGKVETYSTRGEHITLVAPGSSIYTTSLDSSYAAVSGTSFSAPQVAGTAALIWSVIPSLTNDEVRDILIQSASDLGTPGKDSAYGYGLLNTEKAIELVKAKSIRLITEQKANSELRF